MTGSSGTLYTPPKYYRAQRIEIAAKYSGFQLKKVDYVPGKTDKDSSFLAKFPADAVPAFESSDNTCLFDASAIAAFVGGSALKGTEAVVMQWTNWADGVIAPAMSTWVYPCLGVIQFNKAATDHAKTAIQTAFTHLNNYLSTKTFLVGERLSQADITVFCNMVPLFEHVLDAAARAPFPHVVRWFNTVAHQPNVEAVVGKVQLCSQAKQFDGKKYAQLHPKGDAGKKGQEKKETKKKETPKKDEKKPAPKKEEAANDDDGEPKKKEDKDPFLAIPKGTFDMDEFKRTYSNNDIESVAIPYFWEKLDKANYSIWFCEYQYASELKLVFMSSNLITGMMQRLDRMRKHAFGSMAVFGANNNNTIAGLWVWRGQDLAFSLHPDLQIDYDVFTWKKLDSNSDECKALVKQFFIQEGEFQGKKLAQGKIFK